jgi:hypothetical protein
MAVGGVEASERRWRTAQRIHVIHDSVIPLFEVPDKKKPRLIGSACSVRIGTDSFLFSAGHVFKNHTSRQLHTFSAGHLVPITADLMFVESATVDGEDNLHFDFGVMRLRFPKPLPHELTTVDFAANVPVAGGTPIQVVGFPASKAGVRGGSKSVNRQVDRITLSAASAEDYQTAGLRPDIHILIRFDRNGLLDWQGGKVNAHALQGISGGGMFLAAPFEMAPSVASSLLAITVGFVDTKNTRFCGVRLPLFFAMLVAHFGVDYADLPADHTAIVRGMLAGAGSVPKMKP